MRTYSRRPRKPNRLKRLRAIAAFLNAEEDAIVMAAVKRHGSTIAEFVRGAVLKAAAQSEGNP